ncbi:unnamed protein product, partial [Candidula unifasciata]
CPGGYFGWHCKLKCENCEGEECDQDTGKCLTACKNGFYGHHCLFVCPANLYGDGCVNQCHCKHPGEVCDQNGVCKSGCADGWTGIQCQT